MMQNGSVLTGIVLGLLVAHSPISGANITYQEDSTTYFKNPERGVRDGSETLFRKYIELGDYRNTDILPQSVFNTVSGHCNDARSKGMKIIPRFRYYLESGTDAPLARILKHIDQLGPVLRANSDVIVFLEAGFIGAWGEWHHWNSSDVNKLDNTESRRAILFKLLDVMPKDRMVVIRYNSHKRQIFGTNEPLGPDSAFSGSHRARTGAKNDCFRATIDDEGTYRQPPYTESIESQKVFLSLDNRYVPQEGESCGSSKYSECDSALHDLKRMHYDALQITSFKSQWSSGGCLNKILMNFGHRMALKKAEIPDSVFPGSHLVGSLSIINRGFGKLFNPRGCEFIFKNIKTGAVKQVDIGIDPRRFCMTDSVEKFPFNISLPPDLAEGSYSLYLNLPDTASRLKARKEYAVRLANVNIWDDATGYNNLKHTIVVSKNMKPVATLNPNKFQLKEAVSIEKSKGSIAIQYSAPPSTLCSFTVYTLSGLKIWETTANDRFGKVRWTGAIPGVYLLKVAFKNSQMVNAEQSQLLMVQ
jgi:Domain of unknown function (DUF4832)/Domain of unknown function (DUF4874)